MCQPKPISLADYSPATGERSFNTTLGGGGGNSGLVHTWSHSFISHMLVFPFTNAAQPLAQIISGVTGSILNISFSRPPKRESDNYFFICTDFMFDESEHLSFVLIWPPSTDSSSQASTKSQECSIIHTFITYLCVENKFSPLEGTVISQLAKN